MRVCVCVCECISLDRISSLMHISLNNIDIFCLHIFVYALSSYCIDFMISGGNYVDETPIST